MGKIDRIEINATLIIISQPNVTSCDKWSSNYKPQTGCPIV